MGLDMYLTARKSSYRPYKDEQADDTRTMLVEAANTMGLPNAGNIDFITIEREVGYWRKANQIHNWFVTNCQDGVDECQSATLDTMKLVELRDLCTRLLVNKNAAEAAEVLETASGFFFGSTEIDQYYWDDLADTVKIIDRALAIPGEVEFIYRASW